MFSWITLLFLSRRAHHLFHSSPFIIQLVGSIYFWKLQPFEELTYRRNMIHLSLFLCAVINNILGCGQTILTLRWHLSGVQLPSCQGTIHEASGGFYAMQASWLPNMPETVYYISSFLLLLETGRGISSSLLPQGFNSVLREAGGLEGNTDLQRSSSRLGDSGWYSSLHVPAWILNERTGAVIRAPNTETDTLKSLCPSKRAWLFRLCRGVVLQGSAAVLWFGCMKSSSASFRECLDPSCLHCLERLSITRTTFPLLERAFLL